MLRSRSARSRLRLTDVRNWLAEEWPGEFVELRPRGREQFDAIRVQAIDSNREHHRQQCNVWIRLTRRRDRSPSQIDGTIRGLGLRREFRSSLVRRRRAQTTTISSKSDSPAKSAGLRV